MFHAAVRRSWTRSAGRLMKWARAWPHCRRQIGRVRSIVAILTDGLENSSQTYNWRQIAASIKHQAEKYQWTFLFLGANQDAIATAAQMNIAASNAATYLADETASARVSEIAWRGRCVDCTGL